MRKTLIFICKNADEAFELIKKYSSEGYWAQIICLTSESVELHLRPLEEKDY